MKLPNAYAIMAIHDMPKKVPEFTSRAEARAFFKKYKTFTGDLLFTPALAQERAAKRSPNYGALGFYCFEHEAPFMGDYL